MMTDALDPPRSAPSLLKLLVLAIALPLSGCAFLPSDGPDKGEIEGEYRDSQEHPFHLIDISSAAISQSESFSKVSFASHFGDSQMVPPSVVQIGDGVEVEVWETGSDTLFAPRSALANVSGGGPTAARGAALSEQIVGPDGGITVPFAGRMIVLGENQVEVEKQLTQALAGKASRAQVVVHIRNLAGTVTVAGDVTVGARVPLSIQGERILDVLAAAGGVKAPSFETRIQLRRGDQSFSVPYSQVLQNSVENIYVRPGDLLVATREPQSFTAFGATGRNAQFEFGAPQVSLIEAVAKTGGLLDSRADPRGVYLLRYEPRSLVEALESTKSTEDSNDDYVRVVYRLDLTRAGSYFLAQRFSMRDRDIIYVTSAPTNQLQKLLELVGLVSQPIIQGAVLHGALQ